jgi:putative DNA primase/helicase
LINGHNPDRARNALYAIPADLPRDQWVKAGMAAHAAGLPFDDFDQWSAQADSYNAQACKATFRSFKAAPGGVTAGALFGMARDHGWSEGTPRPAPERAKKPVEPPRAPAKGQGAAEVFSRCEPATNQHGYIEKKQGTPDGLRLVAADDKLTIAGQCVAGYLAVPAYAPDGEIQSIQFVPPAGGKKLNLPGASMAGASFTLGTEGPVYLCEGIGAAWSAWKATGHRAICCFGWGNIKTIAGQLRQKDATAKLVLCPDVGKETDAAEIAAMHQCAVAAMPEGWPNNSDMNDLFCSPDGGFDAVQAMLEAATEPPVSYPVSVAFADELPDQYDPPDELLEGVLTAGDGSVLYGDSNSGKTFLVIDIAAAVARGVPWMNRRTEPGLVVYLAAESPASVRGRLQAYQKHHGCKVPNFAIVQSPIDLFDGDADTNRVITLVHQLERQRGQKVGLIVGDTLARLSAGANENAGQDMGLVVRRFDRIRTECKAHFLLIHHSGKAAAAGARGWSGIRAAVDTEIEISDSPSGRCVEITKQRDLSTKGERIGFRLDVVTLGHTKWGEPATSCVVAAADAPVKQVNKRMGEVEGAVVEFLAAHKIGIKKSELAKHFDGRYDRSNVYRAVRTLVTAQAVHEAAGMVCIAEVAK